MSQHRHRSPMAVLLAVGFSVFVAADDLTVVSTMLRPMIIDVGLTLPDGLNDAAWIVNAYLIAFVAVMPLSGRLSDVIGRRRTFLWAYLVFLVGTIVVPLAPSLSSPFTWLLVGRLLTAIGGGAMVPVALAAVADVYPPGPRSRALGTLGAIETLGWVWGPLYGALLVRYLDWRWQFWLNIPLTIVGMALCWWALDGLDRPRRRSIDWVGAGLLTTALVSLSVALLNGAEIQSVSGLEELTGQRRSTAWLYPVAALAAVAFIWWERRQRDPLIDTALLHPRRGGRTVLIALVINLLIGAGLVVAMVDVPLFVNAIELDIQRAAVISGWVLSALTAAMALASYIGGRLTERTTYRAPTVMGSVIAAAALAWMALTWSTSDSFDLFAVQLALLGTGFGLTIAPTSSAVVDAAPSDDRGTAAGVVMLARLLGLCIGLSVLTAWALHRFEELRSTIDLPPLGSDGFEAAVLDAQRTLTASAIADTFGAAAVIVAVGALAALGMRHHRSIPSHQRPAIETHLGQPVPLPGAVGADIASAATPSAVTRSAGTPSTITTPMPSQMKGSAMEPTDPASPDDIPRTPPGRRRRPLEPLPAPNAGATTIAMDELRRRMNLLVGALGLLLLAAIAMIAVLVGRVNQANADAAAARAEVEEVAGGAALYASQIQGFQEQLAAVEPEISEGVDAAITGLDEFSDSTLEFPVSIDQTVPIETEVVIERTIEVPIDLDIPIKQTIDTTIEVGTPLGPVPVDISVPVDVTVPIDETLEVPINETIPITEDVPIKLDVPVEVDVAETDLATLTDSIARALETLQGLLAGFSNPDAGSPTATTVGS